MCCEKTSPQSYRVMLQLPPTQLKSMFDSKPALREPLLEHVQGFTESQRAHVAASTMEVLYNADVAAKLAPEEEKQEPEDQEMEAPAE